MPEESGGFAASAARWSGRGMRLILGVIMSVLALLLSWAALLNIIIRDIPEPSSMAEDVVADLAVGIGVADAEALEIAQQAVASLDGSYLNGSLDTADNIRLGILGLPWILLVLIGLILLITPSGWRRRRWAGWMLMMAGGGLVILAGLLDVDARNAADGTTQGVLDTTREFIGNLLAPAWPIGLIAFALGFVLWLWGMVMLVRGNATEGAGS